MLEKDRLVGDIAGDREREPHGGDTGDVVDDDWFGLDVETGITVEVFWLTIGDRHLELQGGDSEDVVVDVWFSLDVETDTVVEVFWLVTGD